MRRLAMPKQRPSSIISRRSIEEGDKERVVVSRAFLLHTFHRAQWPLLSSQGPEYMRYVRLLGASEAFSSSGLG
jgi:hypothetical protein